MNGMEPCLTGGLKQPPVLDRLKEQEKKVQQELSNIQEAIVRLESNPEVCEVLEALNRLGHY